MSAFTGPLTITELKPGRRVWALAEPLRYEVGFLGSGRVIEAPAGQPTDGASVPRPLWWFLPSWGSYSRAAVIHDYLCDRLNDGRPHPEAKSWAEAARVFREAMKVCRTPPLVRWLMWAAVRLWALGRDGR